MNWNDFLCEIKISLCASGNCNNRKLFCFNIHKWAFQWELIICHDSRNEDEILGNKILTFKI